MTVGGSTGMICAARRANFLLARDPSTVSTSRIML
jgi:hypothetical protein